PACRGGSQVRNQKAVDAKREPPPRLSGWSGGSYAAGLVILNRVRPESQTFVPPRQAGWGRDLGRARCWLRTVHHPGKGGGVRQHPISAARRISFSGNRRRAARA